MKLGVFDGPQNRKLMNDEEFLGSMNPREALACQAFVDAARNIYATTDPKTM